MERTHLTLEKPLPGPLPLDSEQAQKLLPLVQHPQWLDLEEWLAGWGQRLIEALLCNDDHEIMMKTKGKIQMVNAIMDLREEVKRLTLHR